MNFSLTASAVTRLRWRFFKIMLIALLIIGALIAFAIAIDDARIEREAAQINGAWIRSRQR